MSRTTVLTEPLMNKIVKAVKEFGMPPTAAGELFGVSAHTVREWLRRGEDRDDRPNDEIFATFATRIRRAEAMRMTLLMNRVEIAGDNGDWRAAAWMLGRRWPEQWAQRRQPAPAATPTVTIDLVLQIVANVIALDAAVEPLQLVEQLARAFGLTSGSSGTLAQTLAVPALNEPAPVPQRRD
jgi:hypothetical protein